MFKLLGLRVLPGCESHIRKCLEIDRFYYFCSDFRFEDEKHVYRYSKNIKPIPDDFFALPRHDAYTDNSEKPSPCININAIVGKNGDGKSTIVELIMRMVNNYVAERQEKRIQFTAGRDLNVVSGVAAELYFQLNDSIYKLHVTKEVQTLKLIAKITDAPLFGRIDQEAPADVFASIYTFVSNYSHYAYNVYDFQREWNQSKRDATEKEQNEACWLFHVFHKNDGYTTPISLHPYRWSGNIEINKEAHLSQQRLLYLFLNSSDNENAFRSILMDKKAMGIELTQESFSKFQQRSVLGHFRLYEKNDETWDWAIKYLDHLNEALENNPNRPKFEFKNLWDSYCKPVLEALAYVIDGQGCKERRPNQYKEYMDSAVKWLNDNYLSDEDNLRDTSYMSNIDSFFSLIKSIRDKAKLKTKGEYLPSPQLEEKYRLYSRYNIKQLARLRTIYDLAIKLRVDTRLCFAAKILTPADKCKLYMIYKTISIFETYPDYIEIEKETKGSKGNDSGVEYDGKQLGELYKQLRKHQKSHSHITRKFTQAENYVKAFRKSGNSDLYSKIAHVRTDKYMLSPVEVPLENLKRYYGADGITLENLPPAIFDTEIKFDAQDSRIGMGVLSSGEKQMLHTIGAIIYHLQNIDSNGTYESVNLMLEEIELYFHPEYQRLFVMRLIQQIHGAELKNIKNVNLTFVTHSPFVLSDIPKCNVLFLSEGKPYSQMQENTFGANIHSLLKNGFFLANYTMGEFAYQKVNELFRLLNSGDIDDNPKNIEKMQQEIMLVGEPYLREQLYRQFYDLPKVRNYLASTGKQS